MHDPKGKPLKVGDFVMIPAIITQCSGDENFCCLDMETAGVMPGNGLKNSIKCLSAKQVYRANSNDKPASIMLEERDGKTYLI